MLSSPETDLSIFCPICNLELKAQKYINEPLDNHFKFVDKEKTSFLLYNCTCVYVKQVDEYPAHTYSKYCTLYGGNLYEGMFLNKHNMAIRIFNALCKTEIVYYSENKMQKFLTPRPQPEVIVLENRILEPDYPKLEKLISKAKSLATFL